jgi:polar amino acid transport system substrate-binding protein
MDYLDERPESVDMNTESLNYTIPKRFAVRIMKSVLTLSASAVASGALAVFCCFAFPTLAAATSIIKTASQEDASPRYTTEKTEDGHLIVNGLCIDILRAIERVAPDIKFSGDQIPLPLRRVQMSLETGDIDVYCGLNKSQEREKQFIFLEPPLYKVNYKVAVRADDDVQIRSLDDIRKLGENGRILVMNGSDSQFKLQSFPGLKIDSDGADQATNLRKLIARRGRFFYRHEQGLRAEIIAQGLSDKIRILPNSLGEEFQYFLISKKAPPEIVNRIRAAIVKIKNTGELARIRAKYWIMD